jgi:hydrogenase nickel incorporation protein HypB
MKRLDAKQKLMRANDHVAECMRQCFVAHEVLAINIISSPGSGKTSLLEKTLERLPEDWTATVVTGDIATDNDAARLLAYGHPVEQITTDGACHLDASIVAKRVCPDCLVGSGTCKPRFDLLLIENVGNLVCPAGFDLGENAKVVLISVAEGEDKPLKYPSALIKSELLVLNKVDLLPHVNFDVDRFRQYAHRVNPKIEILEMSCTTGRGIDEWLKWLDNKRTEIREKAANLPLPDDCAEKDC